MYKGLWTLNFSEGVSGHELFLVTPNLRPKYFLEYFCLQRSPDSEFFRGDVRAPTFFGHAKFEVKNFFEFFNSQSAVDSQFFTRQIRGPTFFGHTKLEVKSFLEFFPLQNTLD